MNWKFDGDGGWDALSSVGDDGSMFNWRIVVCEDGLEQKLTQQALDLLLKHYKEGNETDFAGEGDKGK